MTRAVFEMHHAYVFRTSQPLPTTVGLNRSWIGGNRHFIRFDDTGETKKIVLKTIKPDEWAVRLAFCRVSTYYGSSRVHAI